MVVYSAAKQVEKKSNLPLSMEIMRDKDPGREPEKDDLAKATKGYSESSSARRWGGRSEREYLESCARARRAGVSRPEPKYKYRRPKVSDFSESDKLQAIVSYYRARANGNVVRHSPSRDLPGDGEFSVKFAGSSIIGSMSVPDGKIPKYMLKYSEGDGDRAWMQERDRSYIAYLEAQEQEEARHAALPTLPQPPAPPIKGFVRKLLTNISTLLETYEQRTDADESYIVDLRHYLTEIMRDIDDYDPPQLKEIQKNLDRYERQLNALTESFQNRGLSAGSESGAAAAPPPSPPPLPLQNRGLSAQQEPGAAAAPPPPPPPPPHYYEAAAAPVGAPPPPPPHYYEAAAAPVGAPPYPPPHYYEAAAAPVGAPPYPPPHYCEAAAAPVGAPPYPPPDPRSYYGQMFFGLPRQEHNNDTKAEPPAHHYPQ